MGCSSDFACRSRLVAPAGEFLFVRDKKEPKSASADGYPAELAARLQRFAQTATGNLNFYVEALQSFGWRAGEGGYLIDF